ncbi:hypothetical protein D3C72_1899760 [compost metagenome]
MHVCGEEAHEFADGRRGHQAVSERSCRTGDKAVDAFQPECLVIRQQRAGLQQPAEPVEADAGGQALEYFRIDLERAANGGDVYAIRLRMRGDCGRDARNGGQFVGNRFIRHRIYGVQ